MLCTRPSTSSVPKWLSCSCIRTGASRGYSAEARPQGRLAKQTISKPASSWPVAEQCRRQYSSRYDARIWSTIADTVGTRLRKEMDDEDLLELLDTSQLSRSQDARLRLQARFKIMTTLFVGHIHSWATHAELKDIFDRFGPNKISWKVLTNGQNSTFAVVGFQSNAALRACVRAFLRNRELFRIRDYPMLLDFTTEDRQHPAVVMTNQIRVGGFQEPVSDEVIKSVFGKFGQIISIARPSHDVDGVSCSFHSAVPTHPFPTMHLRRTRDCRDIERATKADPCGERLGGYYVLDYPRGAGDPGGTRARSSRSARYPGVGGLEDG
ncbi:hypothetical protein OBBRIDRAFT_130144 [Obba rivulosa]|uniref:RRM domain-containing protein n=1 Tax=Obba rivulosa TaxID=1052685 RepID=A0A8E2ANB3_9APHY|nr:hypothetical protein OBBRIDRAFT_130144 [Obba rivulosa]